MTDDKDIERKNQQKGHRERLRAKLLCGNGAGLLDYEILEMVLCAAHHRIDVKPIAKRLLDRFGNLSKVLNAELNQLQEVEGVGNSSIAAIFCIRETLVRVLQAEIKQVVIINSWKKLIDYLKIRIAYKSIENFLILYLNKKNSLIVDDLQEVGTIDQTPLYIREIIKRALSVGASSIIISHNHPSGDTNPSTADLNITQQLSKACLGINISLLDHVIISPREHYSFKSHGLL